MNKKVWLRKTLVLASMMLFVGAGIIPSTGTIVEKKTIIDSKSGSYIQDLIDNASDGDTINIPSGMYYENIVISKPINLIGEDKNSTIIYGNGSGDVVYISANWVNISGFTFQNSGDEFLNAGICINSNYNTVSDNIFSNNYHNGISMDISVNNINSSSNNNIINNIITSNKGYGIYLHLAFNNIVMGNIISKNGGGIYLLGSGSNTIEGNNITSNNGKSIYLDCSDSNTIYKNNFLNNKKDASFFNRWFNILWKRNRWKQNYWNESRVLPKIIRGLVRIINPPGPQPFPTPWFNIDWRPAKEPYDI